MVTKRERGGGGINWSMRLTDTHTTKYKKDEQQGFTV